MTFKTTTHAAGRIGRQLRLACATGLVLVASAASAASGYITTNEAALDLIFSQANIDIRFNAAVNYALPSLTSLDSNADWNMLAALAVPDATVVSMFFVDTISYCDGTSPSLIVGCGEVSGHLLALNSSYAANLTIGPVLAGHELGHNLGLQHFEGGANLMNASLTGNSTLLSAQISTILSSSLIHIDAATSQRYISITPIALLAAVPEPGAWLMMASGLFGLALLRRSRLSRR